MSLPACKKVSALFFPHLLLGGIDEAGRGPLAGPVTAAAVVLRPNYWNEEIADSKKLTETKREQLYGEITEKALVYAIVSVGPAVIDRLNILQASRQAMMRAATKVLAELERLDFSGKVHFLVDGNVALATKLSHETIIKGDDRIKAIGAASILAKVTRDRLMTEYDEEFPGYGFAEHKGYATEYHRKKIRELGPTSIHRRTFAGVKEVLSQSSLFKF